MAKKVILKDQNDIEVLPITRGELVLDASGNPALHSTQFLATDSQPGLMSSEDKYKLDHLEESGPGANNKVAQINTTTDDVYRLLFSETADDTDRTEKSRKSANLTFNPSTGVLNLTGAINANGGTINGNLYIGDSNNTDWMPIRFRRNGVVTFIGQGPESFDVGFDNGYLTVGPDKLKYIKSSYQQYDIIHSGNIGSQSVGNASTADKLKNKVKIWGQDFDGSKDVVGSILSNTSKSNYIVNGGIYYTGAHFYMSDIAAGDYFGFAVGKSYAAKKMAYLEYYQGSDDSKSYLRMGFHSVDNILIMNTLGNVGIGTTSPQYTLDVNGFARALQFQMDDSNSSNSTPQSYWAIYGWDKRLSFTRRNASNNYLSEPLCILYDTSNVGIGITDPKYKLDVNGAIHLTDSVFANYSIFANSGKNGCYLHGTGISWHDSTNSWVKDLFTYGEANDTLTLHRNTSCVGTLTVSGQESNNIYNVYNNNSCIKTNSTGQGSSIRNALNFQWYSTSWQIGNIRGGASDSGGFGVTYGNDTLCFRVTTSDCFVGSNKIIHEGNYKDYVDDMYWANVPISSTSNDKTTPTFANTTVNGIVTVNGPQCAITVNSSCKAAYADFMRMLNPNMSSTYHTAHLAFGYAQSAYNLGYIGFKFVEKDSKSNMVTIGLHSADHILNVLANGKVGIGTTSPSYQLHATSNAKIAGICLEISDEINRYGGHLYIQHRGTVEGSQGSDRTGNICMVYNGGSVNIGSISPQQKLNVGGSILVDGSIRFKTSSPGTIGKQYSDTDTNMYNYIKINEATGGIQYYSGSWTSGDHTAHQFITTSSNTPRLTIKNTTGYVGIGTDSPTRALDVEGVIRARLANNKDILLEGATNDLDGAGIAFWNPSSGWHLGTINAKTLIINTATSGNVGIGTTSARAKLDVNGEIYANPYIRFVDSQRYCGYFSGGKYLELHNGVGGVGIHLYDDGNAYVYKSGTRYTIIHSGNYSSYALPFYLKTTASCNSYTEGLTVVSATDSNAAHTNHSAFLTITNLGTPFQIQIPDSDINYIYKRYKSGSSWSAWSKLSAGYADSAGTATSLGSGALTYMCSCYATNTYNAYKIVTNWHKSQNIMPTINIRGYDYQNALTVDCDIVMYHYSNAPCNYSLTNKGSYAIRVWQAIESDVQVFYISPGTYYGMFNVFVYGGMGTGNFTGWYMTSASAVSGTEIGKNPIATSITGNSATASSVDWSGITNKPSTFTPSTHYHNYFPENTAVYFRDPNNASWRGGMYWGSAGNEALCFVTVNANTSFRFFTGSDLANWTSSTWQGTPAFEVNKNGAYAPHFYESSDIALKDNVKSIINSDNIPQLKSFDWKSDGSHSYGLIAQELEEMGYHELVSNSGSYKTVNYSAALSLIVGKLQVKIKELEKEIEILKNKN